MAVELMMGYGFTGSATANTGSAAAAAAVTTTTTEENALEEAASAGIRSMEKLISLLSQQQQQQQEEEKKKTERVEMDCKAVADAAVTKFRKVISLLDRTSRTGHARFRRAPLVLSSPLPPLSSPLQPTLLLKETKEEVKEEEEERGEKKEEAVRIYCPKPIQQRLPPLPHHHQKSRIFTPSPPVSAVNSSYASSAMTGDTSSSAAFQASAGRPPLQSTGSCSLKRKCGSKSEDGAGAKHTGSGAPGRCHCSKRRKLRVKRTVRVPAISLKMADIPPDDFSWRKYGQKPIKGSPHPRGYYKCSSVRGCPARKHVERALDDPAMLVVTYEGDHSHTPSASDGAPPRLLLDSSS